MYLKKYCIVSNLRFVTVLSNVRADTAVIKDKKIIQGF